MRTIFLLLLLSFLTEDSVAQWNLQGGLSFSLGTHNRRVGVFGVVKKQCGPSCEFGKSFQLGARMAWHYYFAGMGSAQKRMETRLGFGIDYSVGRSYQSGDYFALIQRNKWTRVGYWYDWYLEKDSPQPTGAIVLNFGNFELITENDALGFQGKDKFRTGTVSMAWYENQHRIGVNIQLWTGNPHDPLAKKYDVEPGSNMRWGYTDLSATKFGKISHGILALDYTAALKWNQTAHLRIGIDDERIRHAIQNKLFHDWLLAFTKYNGIKNRHVPMLDDQGNPFLDKEKQRLKPTRFFFDSGLNLPDFY